ncbi:response regulator transcription factor [candidate division KSB1 bacterium]|nr:response regulator transcription factor [candidate division KSB1 bacterium]
MKTVLLIDDSTAVRERLIEMISTVSHIQIVGQASNGREGVAYFELYDPNLVILDINMPEINGIDVLKTIKNTKPETVIIMLTNFPYPQYRDTCMKAGADYFFDKSNEFEQVIEVLQSS